ncbi:MAG: alpha/beta fold hydrolase [Bernardetiaceae bacterium]|nr:alpha/beta fold hydrolase [Bernardetiaceae bacterium]
MKYVIVLLTYLLFSLSCQLAQAQGDLKRKAALGARLEFAENSIRIVEAVQGTSVAIKLQKGDIIQEINGTKINDYESLISVISNKIAGDPIEITILRDSKATTLTGNFAGVPLETSAYSDVIYDQAAYKDGQLRVIINKPKQSGKLPALLFIPGYTCSSIDNLAENHPYKRMIDAYAKAGFVTLRIEKSGLGDSYNTPPCESCDLYDEIENFEVGLKKLKSLPYVDTTKVIIMGHSMGGIIAPALSAKHNVAGVIVYGTTAKSWFEYQIEMYRVQHLLAEMEPLEYEKSITDQYELNYRFFVEKERLEDLAKDPKNDTILRTQWMYDGKGMIYSRNAEYWRQIQDMPHLENWKNTNAKVLVQFGESDFQAFSKADHEQIVRTVNYYHPDNATLQVFPETDHYYAKSGTMKEAFDKFNNQQYMQLFDAYNFDVGNSAVAWSLEVINGENKSSSKVQKWNKLDTEYYPGKQDNIYFVDESTGWYVNGYGKIFHTKDGGKTWEKQWEKEGSFFRTIAFIDKNIGFVGTVGTDYFPNVTDTIPLYKTTDGGKTWNPVAYEGPYVKGLCAIDIVKEPYINHGKTDYKYHIYAVGRVGSPANMLVSHDGGQTWKAQSMNTDCKMLFDIYMTDKNNGFVCAATDEDIAKSNALILKTADGGKTWQKVYQSNRPFETTWKVAFPTDKVGYVTIQSYNPDPQVAQQRIAKTTDGGNTWVEFDLVQDAQAREFGIGFIDEKHGFVGTANAGYETQDGGKSWAKIDLGIACNKIRIYKTKEKIYGFAIGLNVFKFE